MSLSSYLGFSTLMFLSLSSNLGFFYVLLFLSVFYFFSDYVYFYLYLLVCLYILTYMICLYLPNYCFSSVYLCFWAYVPSYFFMSLSTYLLLSVYLCFVHISTLFGFVSITSFVALCQVISSYQLANFQCLILLSYFVYQIPLWACFFLPSRVPQFSMWFIIFFSLCLTRSDFWF